MWSWSSGNVGRSGFIDGLPYQMVLECYDAIPFRSASHNVGQGVVSQFLVWLFDKVHT